eukprot:TRINITY_DN3208_c0_g1_i1.p1 TRINITY_DN3208_c0_g1~~TRINITY_DN3208_c0_g1_i1.p1  ORF type:complete len:507 (-),score=171.11 TRINITY_DN3208_c0_g1_i1:148-1668(-)
MRSLKFRLKNNLFKTQTPFSSPLPFPLLNPNLVCNLNNRFFSNKNNHNSNSNSNSNRNSNVINSNLNFGNDKSNLSFNENQLNQESLVSIKVDCSNIYQKSELLNAPTIKMKQTPLMQYINSLLKVGELITIEKFMEECLTNIQYGYYITQNSIGSKGDFITAPEISQLFGEMIGYWCIDAWYKLGQPNQFNLIELGPGTGKLISDILNVSRSLPKFHDALSIHLIERSPLLRSKQATALNCKFNNTFFQKDLFLSETNKQVLVTNSGTKVFWYSKFSDIVSTNPSIIIAQEFFDALPVHWFKRDKKSWKEILITDDITNDKIEDYKLVISKKPNFNCAQFISLAPIRASEKIDESKTVEISLEAIRIFKGLMEYIKNNKGAVLTIDYGNSKPEGVSLRGFKNHTLCSPFEEPGLMDLTANVDFGTLEATANSMQVFTHKLVTQREFLLNLGIEARLIKLLKSANESEAQNLISSYLRITDNKEMGEQYKVFCVTNSPNLQLSGFE